MVIVAVQRLDQYGRMKTVNAYQIPPEMHPERIGARLRLVREANGLSRAEIADALDWERTYWSRCENGKRPLSKEQAVQFAVRFGVSLDFLLLGDRSKLPLDLARKIESLERERS